ncbi:glycoside hydrolase family 113 [Bdellovibrio sp. HCB185ZH]|uniref:glycoside hydrolase family 113 n=1 Tax=Bdellovibrio sp. HCB185ZH TaxID=3394235 RepID=UPI0039A55F22
MRVLLAVLMIITTLGPPAQANSAEREAAINIITYWPTGFRVDETTQGQRVQRLLYKIKNLGIDTVIFNFRAQMVGGKANTVTSVVPVELQREEEYHLEATIHYAKALGLNVAFRPILLVVGPHGEFPYEDEEGTLWWHGVIQPEDPEKWFQSFFKYHERYMKIAARTESSWYSVGAEMHSLTSGLGSRNPPRRFGRPDLWLQLTYRARDVLGPRVKMTYGANYTDQYVLEDGKRTWGGEFEQWRHDLTFDAQTDQEILHQQYLRNFWNALDFVGLDYYRALGAEDTDYPSRYDSLINVLTPFSYQYALNLQNALTQINQAAATHKYLAIQEVGYRSVEKCFVSPYLYEDGDTPINYQHQAAAWDALLMSVWSAQSSWMRSVGIWQVLVDEDTDTSINGGFSPLGKEPAEQVLKKYFNPLFNEVPLEY